MPPQVGPLLQECRQAPGRKCPKECSSSCPPGSEQKSAPRSDCRVFLAVVRHCMDLLLEECQVLNRATCLLGRSMNTGHFKVDSA